MTLETGVDNEPVNEEKTEKLTGLAWWIHEAKETGMTIAIFLPIWLLLTSLAFELRSIPSESMVPNLQIGDRVAVAKYAYGYDRYSPAFGIGTWFTKEDKSNPNQKMFASVPKRGDVVVFRHPNDNKVMIKRLIGLPGDRIQMIDGHLHINGEAVEREVVRRFRYAPHGRAMAENTTEYRETLPNGVSYLTHKFAGAQSYDNTPVFEVPEDHVFMMGDNRDNSEDSRAPFGHIELYNQDPTGWGGRRFRVGTQATTIGYVPFDHLMGRGETVLFTLSRCKKTPESKCPTSRVWKGL
ncbi:signal peptidase I [Hirschia baltica]|uniref:Signal peptidase I n=1 Tax=Hirschia baltica (strain ATCC 49814 / DSM 5838 / IFAM 1418) TaxID=582402 RepID=C6XI49_HIRBI|nr:signal peptidase I [Hirschia baltica]ACT58875.1 signal peptidase I [Hirschia baltica ATCC 49814]